MMTRKTITLLVALLMVTGAVACKKKQPKTQEDMTIESEPVEPETTEVTSPDGPGMDADQQPDPWDEDLQSVDALARERGLLGDIFFDFDKSTLRNEARDRLEQNAEFLNQHPEFVVTIEGHADERDTNEYNLALGERRANAAKDYLVSLGVSGDRLRTISYGEERPFCTQSTESCWQKNRRAHFVITGRTDVGG